MESIRVVPRNFTQSSDVGRYQSILPLLFLIWIILTVVAPISDIYKAWFHLAMAIPTLVFAVMGRISLNYRDPLFVLSMGLTIYVGLSSIIVSQATVDEHLRAIRWSLETGLLVPILFVTLSPILRSSHEFGRFLLVTSIVGAAISLFWFLILNDMTGRLNGLGALSNPIQAASVLLIYFFTGCFLVLVNYNNVNRLDTLLLIISGFLVFSVTFFSESRGPIISMVLMIVYLFLIFIISRVSVKFVAGLFSIFFLSFLFIFLFYGVGDFLNAMTERGVSYRFELWEGLLKNLPESILWGHGAATNLANTPAGAHILLETGFHEFHAHNLFIGAFVETGLAGLLIIMSIFLLLLYRLVQCNAPRLHKQFGIGIVGLVVSLCMTDTHTLVISAKAVWFFTWLPLIVLWLWAGQLKTIGNTD